MKELYKSSEKIMLVFSKGDELTEMISLYCQKEKIFAASVSALGACEELTLAWYNLETKKYEDHRYKEDMEIASMVGNIALVDDTPFLHAHGVFGMRDMSTIGGHIRRMIISATGEVMLQIYDGSLNRAYDEQTGLNLISCHVRS